MEARRLTLTSIAWSSHQLVMRFAFDALQFSTVYWYPGIDLLDLDRRYGPEVMERVHVHSALFEINKIASLGAAVLDLGPYARHHTEALETLWSTVFHKVWAQWRYENDLPAAQPPVWASQPVSEGARPARLDTHADALLLFCGGGKDSLVTMKLLERAGLPYASFAYAASTYGPVEPQFRLIEGLQDHGAATRRERMIVLDDFFDAPVLPLYGEALGVKTVTAAETPSSIFGTVPLLLSRGYRKAVVGHEASANTGNLVWDKTGEDVNHQWGKSVEAEALLDDYLRTQICEDLGVFSLLMPIHDVTIFSLLNKDLDALPAAHSCNVAKPWCRRCPKCAYVWLGYRAHLPAEDVEAIFPEDLLEVPENEAFFHDMVGLGAHTPFECIGQVEESRLALLLCRARGLLGPRGLALAARLPPMAPGELSRILDRFLAVNLEGARLPQDVAAAVGPLMEETAREARARILGLLQGR